MIAVGFDFDHTLGLDHKLERTAFLDVVEALRGEPADAAAGRHADLALAAFRGGGATIDDAMCAAFAATAPGAEPETALLAFRERALALVPQHVTAVPFARELIAQLDAAAVPHAILTNGWSPLQERKAEAIGYRGPVLVSAKLGVRKPSADAFAALAAALGDREIWYVGDEPVNDAAGAIAAGLRAVWFDWESREYPAGLAAPTAIIHSLAALPAVIGIPAGAGAC